jgi:nicotinamidase-related amidase
MTRYGLFDADGRELDPSGRGLAFRPRVAPIVPSLDRLYAAAEARGWPLVFTTCCSGRMPRPGDVPGVLHVPLDPSDDGWVAAVPRHRVFHVAKNAYGDPAVNAACRAWDAFADNPNATRLVRALPVDAWAVFGNGFDNCVASAARGLLAAGRRVLVLEDVRVSSAGGTPESERRTLDSLREAGAAIRSIEDFLGEA